MEEAEGMSVRNHRDLWAGVMFFAFGIFFVIFSQRYTMGTAARMGPAYFPTALGALLAVLGLIIFFGAFSRMNEEAGLSPVGWRELLLVLLSVGLFALLLPLMGMVISLIILIGVSSLASHEFSLKDTIGSAVVLIALSYLVFAKGLELQFPVWPSFLTR
jgi:hypothetical protein